MKKIGKTTRPLRYDLNKIHYNYIVEVTNRFKGLDLIECLKKYGWRFMALCRRQGLSRSFTGWGRKPLVPSTCAGDLRKV